MKTRFLIYFLLVVSIGMTQGQAQTHFISDIKYRSEVNRQFLKQKELAKNRSHTLFSVFDQKLTPEEKEALEFLYAYMPLSDLADYSGSFYLRNVRIALKAKRTFSWGKTVSEDIFRHFVLPPRAGNENLDTARSVFFNELKERIKNLSMKDAALEVNHWCHEKVTYQGSDERTSSPLNTVKNAFGRCGEESVFTVTALRSVGLPARQIYTPRWAHSDDNHAWVEVWVEGKWYFMGACEPEPDLNMGWFAGPATRAMMLHTKVYGNYLGKDEVVNKTDLTTEINVLPQYAPAKRVIVKVLNSDYSIAPDIPVEFGLYNYAEFYPLAKSLTNKKGICSLLTGYGDLLIWAGKNNQTGYQKISVGKTDTVKIILQGNNTRERTEDYDIIPPIEGAIVQTSEKGKEENIRRIKLEDQIRQAYEKTFIDSIKADEFAFERHINADSTRKILIASRGNWKEIEKFLQSVKPELRHRALQLLYVISDKDLHDTPAEVLSDHLLYSRQKSSICNEIFHKFILNPRISNELISSYKHFFIQKFGKFMTGNSQKDIAFILNWISQNIKILDQANSYRVPIRPAGVYELRYADQFSRKIFFVALCRSLGIPAQLEAARGIAQVYQNNTWNDVYFEKKSVSNLPKGELVLNYQAQQQLKPEYYIHFTLGKFDGSTYKTLDYESSSVFDRFPASLSLDTGNYRLITGIRQPDGSVLCKIKFFNITANREKKVDLQFRDVKTGEINVNYGSLPPEQKIILYPSHKPITLKEFSGGKGSVLIWINPDKEPTKHLMEDLSKLKNSFDSWNGSILILVKQELVGTGFEISTYKNFPKNTYFAIDQDDFLAKAGQITGKAFNQNFPIVIVTRADGKIGYYSSGYKIGNGEQIVKQLNP